MTRILDVTLSVVVGYLVGSISFPRLAVRLAFNQRKHAIPDDASPIRTKFGADRASIVLGTKLGVLMGILDMLKVAVPMIYFKLLLYPGELFYLVLSIAGLVGHNWPLYYKFKGGRGFSVMFSSFIVIDWLGAAIVMFLGLLLGMVVVQNLMVAYVSWLWLMIPWLYLRTFDYFYLVYSLGLVTIFMITTVPEIKTFIQLSREGTREAFFRQDLYDSSPRWRGMKKINERLIHLGFWRFFIAAGAFILLALFFRRLPSI